MLALPGSAYLYQGEELGLPEVTTLPDGARKDPVWERSGHTIRGRDGCRVPLPWTAEGPAYGFSTSAETWLPQPAYFGEYAANRQDGDPVSTLSYYRKALETRRKHALGAASLEWNDYQDDVIAFTNGPLQVVANLSTSPIPLPSGEVVLTSVPDAVDEGQLAPDAAVWIQGQR
jgi:alpha-glucosidase